MANKLVTYVPRPMPTLGGDQLYIQQELAAISNAVGAANAALKVDEATLATNTTAIATINALRASASVFGLAKVDGTTITASGGVISAANQVISPAPIRASLGADIAINNNTTYFDGPSIAQGSVGTWWVSGSVTVLDTVAANSFVAKLWDGTTVIDSGYVTTAGANYGQIFSFSGFLASPAGNLRISVKSTSSSTGKMVFNTSSNSKDCTISAFRIA